MLKSRFNTSFVDVWIGSIVSKTGITPNSWTMITFIPAILGFFSLYLHNLPLAVLFFFSSSLFDMFDGSVARKTQAVSNFGGFLDGVSDRYVEIIIYVGLWLYLQDSVFIFSSSLWIILLVFGAMMPSYVRAYADHRKVVTEPDEQRRMGGFLERPERLALIFIGMILGCFNTSWLLYTVAMVAVLSNLTALQRILFVVKKMRNSEG